LAIVVVAAGAVAYGGDDDDGDDPAAAGGARVAMTEYAFDPDPITVDADDPDLQVVNEGTIDHNLLVRTIGKGAPDLGPGESFTLDLDGIEPGTYPVVCDLPGHTEAGMVTELIVR
jgi:plastocyanin